MSSPQGSGARRMTIALLIPLLATLAGCETAIELPDIRVEFSLLGLFVDAVDNTVSLDM